MTERLRLVFATAVLLFGMRLAFANCPEVCKCKWKGGKQTVECVNASLSSIPEIESDTQVLDFGHNYLPTLTTDIFQKLSLHNLQKIYLAHCSLRNVEQHSFRGLTNLVDLDLSGNALASVPTSAVEDCKYLMRLSLRGNPIRSVGNEAFRGLHELIHLDLSESGLETVHVNAFRGLDSLEYLRLDSNKLNTLSPKRSFPANLRDLTLHRNRWHCDCHLLELHTWLQNFTVPYSVEPKCHSPPRLIGEEIKMLQPQEFACIPAVSPTTMYLEVIEGKNMSLVCTIKAIPEARVTWQYKETFINNGSTLVNDIDMRHYFYVDSGSGANKKSELFLSATSVDDNGTFACIAENKAGKARAEFTLHVVVPMPPKPPQDVVEERFRTEYLIALVVAVVLLLIISLVVTTLLAMRCQRTRAKRHRAASIESGRLHRSRSGGDISNTDTIATQMTPAASCGSAASISTGNNGTIASAAMLNPNIEDDVQYSIENNPDLLTQLSDANKTTTGDDIRLALLTGTIKGRSKATNNEGHYEVSTMKHPKQPPPLPKRSASYDMFRMPQAASTTSSDSPSPPPPPPHATTALTSSKSANNHSIEQQQQQQQLSPPTPFADDSFVAATLPHLMGKNPSSDKCIVTEINSAGVKSLTSPSRPNRPVSRTLPRKLHSGNICRHDVNRKSLTDATIPPPPQYKGVHFAPSVDSRRKSVEVQSSRRDDDDEELPIPVEGLPTKPAAPRQIQAVIPAPETVAITLRNSNPVPLLTSMKVAPQSTSSTFTTTSSTEKPVPPPKSSSLKTNSSSKTTVALALRDKAKAASAAGREIVFVSPDEGFNEDVSTVSTKQKGPTV